MIDILILCLSMKIEAVGLELRKAKSSSFGPACPLTWTEEPGLRISVFFSLCLVHCVSLCFSWCATWRAEQSIPRGGSEEIRENCTSAVQNPELQVDLLNSLPGVSLLASCPSLHEHTLSDNLYFLLIHFMSSVAISL